MLFLRPMCKTGPGDRPIIGTTEVANARRVKSSRLALSKLRRPCLKKRGSRGVGGGGSGLVSRAVAAPQRPSVQVPASMHAPHSFLFPQSEDAISWFL